MPPLVVPQAAIPAPPRQPATEDIGISLHCKGEALALVFGEGPLFFVHHPDADPLAFGRLGAQMVASADIGFGQFVARVQF